MLAHFQWNEILWHNPGDFLFGMRKKIVLFGPGPYFKGGLANYNISLARAMDALGIWEVHLVSWTQQYPALIPRDFADTKSKEDKLGGTNVQVHYITDYNKPSTWSATVDLMCRLQPECVVIQWSIALQGLPLGFIVKSLRKKSKAEVLFDLHFVVQKEQSSIDRFFTKFALKHASGYIVHAGKTADELQEVLPERTFFRTESGDRERHPEKGAFPVLKLFHPVYDMFRPDPHFDVAAEKQRLGLKPHVFLFFGFIRKYKGLHYCIDAFEKLAQERDDVSLLVVGESFWKTLDETKWINRFKKSVFKVLRGMLSKSSEDETAYNPLEWIAQRGLEDRIKVVNDFVPNEEVYRYFQVSDAILLFYEYATPSGVESMAYNFSKPILASKVGHFPETILDGKNGYLAKDGDVSDMAKVMARFLREPIPESNMAEMAERFSWKKYALAISKPWLDAGFK
jgi:glycosyltransferase involved in cell wall biosynthesis